VVYLEAGGCYLSGGELDECFVAVENGGEFLFEARCYFFFVVEDAEEGLWACLENRGGIGDDVFLAFGAGVDFLDHGEDCQDETKT